MASSEVAKKYDARGPVQTLATGCTAGLDAIGHACELIRSEEADIIIAGATEAPITPIALAAFDIVGALAGDRNDAPETASRPYDKTRTGLVLGEGCGVLVLHPLEHAKARGAAILAEVVRIWFVLQWSAYHRPGAGRRGFASGDEARPH